MSAGALPQTHGGAYSAPPDPLAGFKGPTSKERGEKGEGSGGKGRKWTPSKFLLGSSYSDQIWCCKTCWVWERVLGVIYLLVPKAKNGTPYTYIKIV